MTGLSEQADIDDIGAEYIIKAVSGAAASALVGIYYLTGSSIVLGVAPAVVKSIPAVTVGASGVIILVPILLANATGTGRGVYTRFQRDGATPIGYQVQSNMDSATLSNNAISICYSVVDSGLVPGASHTYDLLGWDAGAIAGQFFYAIAIAVFAP